MYMVKARPSNKNREARLLLDAETESEKTQRVMLMPKAGYLLSSMRDIGYSFETAVADLIDNSISASARSVWVDAEWNGGNRFVSITDDGNGLSRADLVEAMRLGSSDPTIDRSHGDLGRFGLGLKTASLSQCRRFTVVSKTKDGVFSVAWDIDDARAADDDGWSVEIRDVRNVSESSLIRRLLDERLGECQSGTIVLWEKIDRPDSSTTCKVGGEKAFTQQLSSLIEHLSLTFHRFLNSESRNERIRLFVNNRQIEGFDPYNSGQLATKQPAPEAVIIRNEKVFITPYVLPHPSKVSAEEYRKYEGKDGYLDNAGFYIYRNKRLISKGKWFRLVRRSNLSKLLRIQVDIPTSLDFLWSIDVRKSQSEVPEDIKKELSGFIKRWEQDAKIVYHHRGTRLIEKTIDPLWSRIANDGKICYRVNRSNPFLDDLLLTLNESQAKALKLYLDMVDAAFPHAALMCDLDHDKQKVENVRLPDDDVMELLKRYVELSQRKWTRQELESVGVFNAYPDVVDRFLAGEF